MDAYERAEESEAAGSKRFLIALSVRPGIILAMSLLLTGQRVAVSVHVCEHKLSLNAAGIIAANCSGPPLYASQPAGAVCA